MKTLMCTNCGTMAEPIKSKRGNLLIEILLWIFLTVIGVIYTIWRRTFLPPVCPACGAPHMVSLDSPIGQRLQLGQANVLERTGSIELNPDDHDADTNDQICTNCWEVEEPTIIEKGHDWIEITLWVITVTLIAFDVAWSTGILHKIGLPSLIFQWAPVAIIFAFFAPAIHIIPPAAILYSIWRRKNCPKGCPYCESTNMVPVDSLLGRQLMGKIA